MTQHREAPQTTCDCAALDALDAVLREHRAASGHLVALNDEGMLCLIDTWPHDCNGQACWGHAWSDAEWSTFLEYVAAHGASHHVTADGRAVIPVMEQQLLWGAVIVDPGGNCPDLLAAAVAPRAGALAASVRQHAE